MIRIPTHPDYHKNQERAGDLLPCVVCGKGIKNASHPKMVHVHNGGTHIITEDEAATLDSAGDMYFFPIGNECLRQHPELRPYVVRGVPAATQTEASR